MDGEISVEKFIFELDPILFGGRNAGNEADYVCNSGQPLQAHSVYDCTCAEPNSF
jgi:hypothetical protein